MTRLRFQFGLRTLLILVAVLAIPLGYVAWDVRIVRERMAVLAEVVRLGGLCRGQAAMHGDPPDPGWIRQILGDPPSRVFFTFLPMSSQTK